MSRSRIALARSVARCGLAGPGLIAVTATFCLVLVSACRPAGSAPTVPAAGRLVYDGRPVPQVELIFMPTTGRPGHATTDAAGHFVVTTFRPGDGAVPGRHRVTLRPARGGSTIRYDEVFVNPQPVLPPLPFPARYASSIETDLEVDLGVSGSRHLELVLADR